MLMETAMMDVRSVTGHNLRNIMLLVGKTSVADVRKSDVVSYIKLEDKDLWKVQVIKDIIDTKAGIKEVTGFSTEELTDILSHLCTE